jgi:hypothetical protein
LPQASRKAEKASSDCDRQLPAEIISACVEQQFEIQDLNNSDPDYATVARSRIRPSCCGVQIQIIRRHGRTDDADGDVRQFAIGTISVDGGKPWSAPQPREPGALSGAAVEERTSDRLASSVPMLRVKRNRFAGLLCLYQSATGQLRFRRHFHRPSRN